MLPPLYERWMADVLAGPTPEESAATCDDCAMLPKPGEPEGSRAVQFTDVKCCTYQPLVHNFLAGGVLSDDSADGAAGRAVLEGMIESRNGVTPLGVGGSPAYWLLYGSDPHGFGNSAELLCSFFEKGTGRCGIWRHRDSTCATWFCKHDRGAVGEAYWRELQMWLRTAERAVAWHCALELGLETEALRHLCENTGLETRGRIAPGLDGRANSKNHRRRWGKLEGRERDFYRSCARIADGLDRAQVVALMGAEGKLRTRILHEADVALQAWQPPLVPLRLGRHRPLVAPPGKVRLTTYRDYDPIDVPVAVFAALQHFDGRPTAEVVTEVEAGQGVRLTPGVLRELTDFELLVPAEPPPELPPVDPSAA